MFTYCNGYWEAYGRFQGDFFGLRRGTWEDLSMKEFVMGEENLNEGFSQDFLALLKN